VLEIGVDATTLETGFLETVAEATQTLNHHKENTLTFYSLILFVKPGS
jgi:hypothetical protein